MFGLLVDSSLEQEIMLDCKHMMDPWSRKLVAKCHREGLRLNDPTARSIIASVEREIRRETADSGGQAHEQARQARAKATFPA